MCRPQHSPQRRRRCCGATAPISRSTIRRPAGIPRDARIRRRQGRGPRIKCTADDVLITSGSGQGIDLVNGAARPRRHRDPRGIHLWRRADQIEAPRRQHHRRAARRRGAADRRARANPRGSRAQGDRAQIHLYDPDHPEPDRLDPAARAPRSIAVARPQARRADLRGRVLRRPDLGTTRRRRSMRWTRAR